MCFITLLGRGCDLICFVYFPGRGRGDIPGILNNHPSPKSLRFGGATGDPDPRAQKVTEELIGCGVALEPRLHIFPCMYCMYVCMYVLRTSYRVRRTVLLNLQGPAAASGHGLGRSISKSEDLTRREAGLSLRDLAFIQRCYEQNTTKSSPSTSAIDLFPRWLDILRVAA